MLLGPITGEVIGVGLLPFNGASKTYLCHLQELLAVTPSKMFDILRKKTFIKELQEKLHSRAIAGRSVRVMMVGEVSGLRGRFI